jgi:hypothetical protein
MRVGRSNKRVIPTQSDDTEAVVNWLQWLPTDPSELRTHNIRIITNVEGLEILVSKIVDRLSTTEKRSDEEPLLVPIAVAAQLLSVSEKTVMRRIKSGELVGMKELDVFRVTMASIRQYIERNRIASEDDDGTN